MNTTRTWTTSHGYVATCTLAQAMDNASYTQLTCLGQAFRALGVWMAIARQKPLNGWAAARRRPRTLKRHSAA